MYKLTIFAVLLALAVTGTLCRNINLNRNGVIERSKYVHIIECLKFFSKILVGFLSASTLKIILLNIIWNNIFST